MRSAGSTEVRVRTLRRIFEPRLGRRRLGDRDDSAARQFLSGSTDTLSDEGTRRESARGSTALRWRPGLTQTGPPLYITRIVSLRLEVATRSSLIQFTPVADRDYTLQLPLHNTEPVPSCPPCSTDCRMHSARVGCQGASAVTPPATEPATVIGPERPDSLSARIAPPFGAATAAGGGAIVRTGTGSFGGLIQLPLGPLQIDASAALQRLPDGTMSFSP